MVVVPWTSTTLFSSIWKSPTVCRLRLFLLARECSSHSLHRLQLYRSAPYCWYMEQIFSHPLAYGWNDRIVFSMNYLHTDSFGMCFLSSLTLDINGLSRTFVAREVCSPQAHDSASCWMPSPSLKPWRSWPSATILWVTTINLLLATRPKRSLWSSISKLLLSPEYLFPSAFIGASSATWRRSLLVLTSMPTCMFPLPDSFLATMFWCVITLIWSLLSVVRLRLPDFPLQRTSSPLWLFLVMSIFYLVFGWPRSDPEWNIYNPTTLNTMVYSYYEQKIDILIGNPKNYKVWKTFDLSN